jgi:hypothetical protein
MSQLRTAVHVIVSVAALMSFACAPKSVAPVGPVKPVRPVRPVIPVDPKVKATPANPKVKPTPVDPKVKKAHVTVADIEGYVYPPGRSGS